MFLLSFVDRIVTSLIVVNVVTYGSYAAQVDYKGYQLLRVNVPSQDSLVELNQFAASVPDSFVEVWRNRIDEQMHVDLFVHPAASDSVLSYLDKNSMPHDVLVNDFDKMLAPEKKGHKVLKDIIFEHGDQQKFNVGLYHSYQDILAHLKGLAEKHPSLVKFGSIGQSFEGRELAYVKLGFGNQEKSKKDSLFIDAGIHAREWISPAVALNTIEQLVNNPKYTQLLQQIDVYILPVLNPDGYEFSRSRDRMWRRTRSRSDGHDCIGVDANRNFPYVDETGINHWNETGTTGYCSQVYSGPRPLSEPETQHLAKFLLDNKSTIKAYLTLHAYGNLIMYPFAHRRKTYPPNFKKLHEVGNRIAKAILTAGGPVFTVGTGADILYEASGTSESYAKSIGINYAYTIELTSGELGGFVFPEESVSEFSKQVIPGILALAEQVAEEASAALQ